MSLRSTASRFAHLAAGLLACAAAAAACAGDLLSGRFYAVPERPFVNQPFVVHFEVEVTPGCEIEDLRIGNFPNNPELVAIGQLESKSRNRMTRNGQEVDVLHFTAQARGLQPIDQTFNPTLLCMLVERRANGFFSHWQSYQRQKNLDPFTLSVRPLPAAGRPSDFSGAVGAFRLAGQLSASSVHPGDIVTLHLELTGQGWLGQAALPCLSNALPFKVYPAKETVREPLRVATDQVLIPAGTNATEIAALRFVFFNPGTARYEEASAGPFPLAFTSEASPKAAAVRVINTAASAAPRAAGTVGELTIDPSAVVARQARPLIAAGLTAALGLWLLFTLFARSRALALFACLAVFALGAIGIRRLGGGEPSASLALSEPAEVRFAPSPRANALFSLTAGTSVVPLERAADWTRIDAQGQRGWVPTDKLSKTAPTDRTHKAR